MMRFVRPVSIVVFVRLTNQVRRISLDDKAKLKAFSLENDSAGWLKKKLFKKASAATVRLARTSRQEYIRSILIVWWSFVSLSASPSSYSSSTRSASRRNALLPNYY